MVNEVDGGELKTAAWHTTRRQDTAATSVALTFGLWPPSRFSCISCATVCSRTLFRSACCRRSFISSKVSSSGCRGKEGQRDNQRGGELRGTGDMARQDQGKMTGKGARGGQVRGQESMGQRDTAEERKGV